VAAIPDAVISLAFWSAVVLHRFSMQQNKLGTFVTVSTCTKRFALKGSPNVPAALDPPDREVCSDRWHFDCLVADMDAIIFLSLGLLCAVVGRALIIAAAFRISWRWGIGVLLPFGPLAFRRNYPDHARPARPLRFATLPCFVLYILLGPGNAYTQLPESIFQKVPTPTSTPATGYALEKPRPSHKSDNGLFRSAPTIEQRRAANAREFERLASQDKELKLRKRDLLRSDVEGNASYARNLAEYNAALAEANKEKSALAAPPH
jgi:hypothetical protein